MERSKLNISWNSDFYQSKENCTVKFYDHENVIASHITGKYDNVQYSANYKIRTTPDWKTIAVEISYTLNNSSYTLEAIHAESQWIVNGIVREEFKNCTDIDITVTPCTNTLPINRLDLQLNNPQQIEVFYINVLENSIYPVRQQYTKKSGTLYNFQNVPNDFEADIIVDTDGFVVHYPELFER